MVEIDNDFAKYVLKQAHLSNHQANWLRLLAEYDFALGNEADHLNGAVDALSRRPVNLCETNAVKSCQTESFFEIEQDANKDIGVYGCLL